MNFKTVMQLAFLNKSKRTKYQLTFFLLIFSLFLLYPLNSYAKNYHAQVLQVDISQAQNEYFLTADFAYQLSPQAHEALQNGVPLFWCLKIKVQKEKTFWFNQTLLEHTIRYRLQYHALLKMYQLKNENTNVINNFSSLNAALNAMATMRNFPLIALQALSKNKNYSLAIKVIFEDEKLPLPLQTQVLANKQWQLSSAWTRWEIPNFDNALR
jgi:hypothetical protein